MGASQASKLRPRHEADLVWFFGAGRAFLEPGSSAGPTLERADVYFGPPLTATGGRASFSHEKRWEWRRALQERKAAGENPALFELEPEITAAVTNETPASPPDPDTDDAVKNQRRAGRTSIRLMALERAMPGGRKVMEALYNDDAAIWRANGFYHVVPFGALFRHVTAGKALIREVLDRQAGRPAKLRLPLAHLMESERAYAQAQRASLTTGEAEREKLTAMVAMFDVAEKQALTLAATVIETWNRIAEEA